MKITKKYSSVCRVPRAFLPVMVGSTRSEKMKVKEQESVVEKDMVRKIMDD